MRLRPAVSASFLFLLFIRWQPTLANTEIVHFFAYEQTETGILPTTTWPILCQIRNEGQWRIQPAPLNTALKNVCEPDWRSDCKTSFEDNHTLCPHELWVTLDLNSDHWKSYSKFTLRLSWPASCPTDFSVQIHGPDELSSCLSPRPQGLNKSHGELPASPPKSRTKYARIRLVDTGILTPTIDIASPLSAEAVPFNLILEPLYFGILPASVLPIVLFLVPVVLVAGLMVPLINAYLEEIASVARQETPTGRAKTA